MIRTFICFLFIVPSFLRLAGQRPSYFMGMRDMVSLECRPSISQVYYDKGLHKLSLVIGARYERIFRKGTIAGVTLSYGRFTVNDNFTNDGNPHNYYISYNDIPRGVNNGNGNIYIGNSAIFLSCRKYRYNRTIAPLGGFLGVRAGISRNVVNIPRDYHFAYTQYYGSLRKDYVTTENQYLNLTKTHVGLEYGKTVRFFKDRMFFTGSFLYLITFGRKYDPEESLNDRFLYMTSQKISRYQSLTFSLNLSYVF